MITKDSRLFSCWVVLACLLECSIFVSSFGIVSSCLTVRQQQQSFFSPSALSYQDAQQGSTNSRSEVQVLEDFTKSLSKAGKVMTGNQEYEFGDITKGFFKELDQSLQNMDPVKDLPLSIIRDTWNSMDKPQRQSLVIMLVGWVAIAVLAHGLWSNLSTSISLTLAWLQTTWATSPLYVVDVVKRVRRPIPVEMIWNPFFATIGRPIQQAFVTRYMFLRIVSNPFWVVVQTMGTILTFRKYQLFLKRIEQNLIPITVQRESPLLGKVVAIGFAFGFNTVVGFLATFVGIGCGSILGKLKWQWFLGYY